MSFTWGLVIGTASPIPYFYSIFFITVLVHRTTRDFERYVPYRAPINDSLILRAQVCHQVRQGLGTLLRDCAMEVHSRGLLRCFSSSAFLPHLCYALQTDFGIPLEISLPGQITVSFRRIRPRRAYRFLVTTHASYFP